MICIFKATKILSACLVVFFSLISACRLTAQPDRPPPEVLENLTQRAMLEIQNFQEYVSMIAAAEKTREKRQRWIKQCLTLFTENAVIEEQNKRSNTPKQWRAKDYLQDLLNRGEQTPVVISFEVTDRLLAEELVPSENQDGSITYKGSMVFRQYYCKLRDGKHIREPTEEEPNINCTYSDTTDKEVHVEITRRTNSKGEIWITDLSSVRVLRVF